MFRMVGIIFSLSLINPTVEVIGEDKGGSNVVNYGEVTTSLNTQHEKSTLSVELKEEAKTFGRKKGVVVRVISLPD